MSELVKRLRECSDDWPAYLTKLDREAADALEAQAKRITELEASLADSNEALQVLGLKLERAEGHSANTVGVPACERTRDRVQQELEAALDCIDELKIYADPGFYHACAFLFDRPTGGFDEDFSYDNDYKRNIPGKTARDAFAKMSEAIAAMPWLSAANCSNEDTRNAGESDR